MKFKTGDVPSPNRVFVDISPARLNSMLKGKEWPVSSTVFQKIRVAQYTDSTVRIVLDGALIKRVNVFTLKDPSRLIIDVAATDLATPPPAPVLPPPAPPASQQSPAAIPVSSPPPAAPPLTRTSTEPVAKPDAPAPTPTPTPALVAANDASATRVVTPAKPTSLGERSLIRALGLKVSKVVIDPGHGGHDVGSIGPSGYTEKELVLDIARRLKNLIEAELGLQATLTREHDGFVALDKRTEIANQERADLFISIHANSSRVRSVTGVETYFLNLNTQSREALETANRENASAEKSVSELGDIIRKMMQNDKMDESRELAQHIQRSLSSRKDAGPDRGVKQAPFVVLMGATMPSILAEISFISNATTERQLKKPEYRQEIAESLLKGIRSYAETLGGVKTASSAEKK